MMEQIDGLRMGPIQERDRREKHGIRFADAIAIFEDPGLLVIESPQIGHVERGFKAIGGIDHLCFAAIFTHRQDALGITFVRDWEQRRKLTDGAARVLLQAIAHNPDAVIKALAS